MIIPLNKCTCMVFLLPTVFLDVIPSSPGFPTSKAGIVTSTTPETTIGTTTTAGVVSTTKCPKCGITVDILSGREQRSCCTHGGAWEGKCGNGRDNKEHTWPEGAKACESKSECLFIESMCINGVFLRPAKRISNGFIC